MNVHRDSMLWLAFNCGPSIQADGWCYDDQSNSGRWLPDLSPCLGSSLLVVLKGTVA
jgi:hypothetical protein